MAAINRFLGEFAVARGVLFMSAMSKTQDHAVQLVDAAYDFERRPREWLQHILESGRALLDYGQGCAAVAMPGPTGTQLNAQIGPRDWASSFAPVASEGRALSMLGPCQDRTQGARTFLRSEACPAMQRLFAERFGCDDVMEVWAGDYDAHGVAIYAPSTRRIKLTAADLARWRALASHISAAYRIRCGLGLAALDAETRDRLAMIREAAARADRWTTIDRDPDLAAEVKQGVLHGELSMVDWFDADGRRFVLVRPNGPRGRDPRALSPREYEVAKYAALGDTGKIIAARLCMSPTLVSASLRSAMRKLGVKTQSQLVIQMRCLANDRLAS